jgi:nucleoside-diphosphate-sugar epimerase
MRSGARYPVQQKEDIMTIFVAGGSGTIGSPLVRALVSAGHRVFASTRSREKQTMIQSLGATPVLMDALDSVSVERAVRSVAPTHVIHELTALPKTGPRKASDLEPTNRLRVEGTRHLLKAAIDAGAKRIVAGSFAPLAGPSTAPGPEGRIDPAAQALQSMESQILEAAGSRAIEGIILRYGLFYGLETPSTQEMFALVRKRWLPIVRHDPGQLPYIHVADAAAATVAALDHGASGSIYDIVDDRPANFSETVVEMAQITGAPRPFAVPAWLLRLTAPYMARILSMQLHLSNAKARRELEWDLMFPSYKEGLRQSIGRAA